MNGWEHSMCSDSGVSCAAINTLDLDELQRILDWSRRQIHVTGWGSDRTGYHVARVVGYLLGQLHLVANGATPVATPWDFRS
jgi:hypothetical protein